jgi:hypothetical protein
VLVVDWLVLIDFIEGSMLVCLSFHVGAGFVSRR